MNLIFDLDGTLIDSRLRLYRLFQHLIPKSNLTFKAYWELKQDKISNVTILASEFGFDEAAIARFVCNWMANIESPEMLALDTNLPGMHGALDRLRKEAKLHVCSARQHRQLAIEQIDSMGLLPYFDSVMVTEQRLSKEELIASVTGLGPDDWVIGDTGKDIQVGQALGIKTCAVLSGFLSEKRLKPYGPDLILPNAAYFNM